MLYILCNPPTRQTWSLEPKHRHRRPRISATEPAAQRASSTEQKEPAAQSLQHRKLRSQFLSLSFLDWGGSGGRTPNGP